MTIRMEAWPALMTREVAAAYITGSLRDIDALKEQGHITPYGHQKRVKYRKADIDAWIESLPERTR